VDSDLRCDILAKLKNAGIDVPFPQRDLHLSTVEPIKVSISDAMV
jgi:small-conductance mechanosensitive channel